MRKHGEKTLPTISVLLCDIRSAHNAGAIMRTAETLGISEIIFGGYTPGPEDRFRRPCQEFIKASLGAEKSISWRWCENYVKELDLLKKKGAYLVAVEQSPHAVDYKKIKLSTRPTVIILGNEVTGLSYKVLEKVDVVAEIPMRGRKESLNVSVAAGIVLYRFFDLPS